MFKGVWLTFYLLLLFPSDDLYVVRVTVWHTGTMWQSNPCDLPMNYFIHQAPALVRPFMCYKAPAVGSGKDQHRCRRLPHCRCWNQIMGGEFETFPPTIVLVEISIAIEITGPGNSHSLINRDLLSKADISKQDETFNERVCLSKENLRSG